MTIDYVTPNTEPVGKLIDRANEHTKLIENLTAAVESLERKVDALVRFELARIAPTVESSNEDVTKTLESAFVRQIGTVDD